MKNRIAITGKKIWRDSDNAADTRPLAVQITLMRDGEAYKNVSVNSAGRGTYTFDCLPAWKNPSHKYTYSTDEINVPSGYIKTVNGFNIINTAEPGSITISGITTWRDNNNDGKTRPPEITVYLLQNGIQFHSAQILTPPDNEDTAAFSFPDVPQFDNNGNIFAYTVDESSIEGYNKTIKGFNITNTFSAFGFSFLKTDDFTSMPVEGAVFELKDSEGMSRVSVSNSDGVISFSGIEPGVYEMAETISPEGYMRNDTAYQVDAASDGTIKIDGVSSDKFSVSNTLKTSVSGVKVWDDNENPDDTRPSKVTVNLYRDGILFRQTDFAVTESETPFIFDDLPRYRSDKTEYDYTVGEDTVPDGYDTSVDGTHIENKIRHLTIMIIIADESAVGGNILAIFINSAPYGSEYTFNSPNLSEYTALEPRTHTFPRVTKDEECTFYYRKNP